MLHEHIWIIESSKNISKYKSSLLGWIKSFTEFWKYVRHNSAAPDAVAEVREITNPTGLWDVELAWYSPSATHWICLYSTGHGLRIHDFRPTWSYLIVEVFVTLVKFLEPFGPVGWGYRIHWLHLCRGVRLPQWVSCMWHETIWWWGFSNAGAFGNTVYPFIVIAPRLTLAQSGITRSIYLWVK